MKESDIIQLLRYPAQLEQYSYHEIRTLVREYPYCQSLYVLLAIKSKMVNHKNVKEDLAFAATASFDRAWLFKLWETELPEMVKHEAVVDDKLELLNLQELIEKADAVAPESSISSIELHAHDSTNIANVDADRLDMSREEEEPDHVDNLEPEHEQIESITEKEAVNLSPQPKSSFSSWLRKFESPDPYAAQSKEPLERNWQHHPDASLQENTDIASETLAQLLEAQGLFDKSIEVYRRLMLIFPEKSAYFARQIQNLDKKRFS